VLTVKSINTYQGLKEEGSILISIPYNWIPTITQNLQEMEWVLPSYTDGREKFLIREERVFEESQKESQDIKQS
jgi:hypothetical protein